MKRNESIVSCCVFLFNRECLTRREIYAEILGVDRRIIFSVVYLLTHTPLTLYEKRAINQYTISFDSDCGNAIDSIIQDYSTTNLEPAEQIITSL